jgi:hypothetical protein
MHQPSVLGLPLGLSTACLALKALANLRDLRVHYAYGDEVDPRERLMLEAFAKRLSDKTCAALPTRWRSCHSPTSRDGQGCRTAHVIKGARAPRTRDQPEPRPPGSPVPVTEK